MLLVKIARLRFALRTQTFVWVESMTGRRMELTMRVALAAGMCVALVLSWRLARVENVCNVGHHRGKNGLEGLDGCYEEGRRSSESILMWQQKVYLNGGKCAEGSLTRKAPDYLVMDTASRSCNSCSLLAGQLAGTPDILFDAIHGRRM